MEIQTQVHFTEVSFSFNQMNFMIRHCPNSYEKTSPTPSFTIWFAFSRVSTAQPRSNSKSFAGVVCFLTGVPFWTELIYMGLQKCVQLQAMTTKMLSCLIIANSACLNHNLGTRSELKIPIFQDSCKNPDLACTTA